MDSIDIQHDISNHNSFVMGPLLVNDDDDKYIVQKSEVDRWPNAIAAALWPAL